MFRSTDNEINAAKQEADEKADREAVAEGERLDYINQVRIDEEFKNKQADEHEQALKKKLEEK